MTISGGAKADRLNGGVAEDTIVGNGGDDTITGGAGNDVLSGGAGKDRFVFASRGFGIDRIVDFSTGDRIDLSKLNVTNMAAVQSILYQDGGNVVLVVQTDGSTDAIILENRKVASLKASDFVFSTSTKPVSLSGGPEGDMLFGGNGKDTLSGGNGDDYLSGGGGADRFLYTERGFGTDVVSDFAKGDRIDLRGLHITGLSSLKDLLVSYDDGVGIRLGYGGLAEEIGIAGRTAKSLKATDFIFDTSAQAWDLKGTTHDDVIFGAKGDDTLTGNGGADRLDGGAGNDWLAGGTGNDTLVLGGGRDVVDVETESYGNFGIDHVYGFGKDDKIDVSTLAAGDFSALLPFLTKIKGGDAMLRIGASSQVVLHGYDLSDLTAGNFGFAHRPPEADYYGSGGNEIMIGWKGRDRMMGNGGNDTLSGGAGNDHIEGGSGADVMAGGDGADTFVFRRVGDSATKQPGGPDVILDFSRKSGDKIDLHSIDGNQSSNHPGTDAFKFIGSKSFSGKAGEIRYAFVDGDTHLYAKASAGSKSSYGFEIVLEGHIKLLSTDFII